MNRQNENILLALLVLGVLYLLLENKNENFTYDEYMAMSNAHDNHPLNSMPDYASFIQQMPRRRNADGCLDVNYLVPTDNRSCDPLGPRGGFPQV